MFAMLLSLLVTPASHYIDNHLYGADQPGKRLEVQQDISAAVAAVVAKHSAPTT